MLCMIKLVIHPNRFWNLLVMQGDAALLNLSLLTSDFYGLIIGIYARHLHIDALYIAGVMCIVG